MQWVLLTFSMLSLAAAGYALTVAASSATTNAELSAELALISGRLSALEAQPRLTPSQLVELQELNDAVEHARQLLIKAQRRSNGELGGRPIELTDKAAIRRAMMAGRLRGNQ